MISYRCSYFLIFRNLGFPLAVGFSDPLGLDSPGSLGLSNSKLAGLLFISNSFFHAQVWVSILLASLTVGKSREIDET